MAQELPMLISDLISTPASCFLPNIGLADSEFLIVFWFKYNYLNKKIKKISKKVKRFY